MASANAAGSDGTQGSVTGAGPTVQVVAVAAEPPAVGLWASLSVLGRRWPILLVGFVLTLAAAAGAYLALPSSYSATGTLLLDLPTATATDAASSNPVFGTRSYVADLVVTMMAAPDAAASVVANGGTGEFSTSLGGGDAVLVQLVATGDSQQQALDTWNAAAKETSDALLTLQRSKGASDDDLVTISPLTVPVDALKDSGSRIRAVVATLVLGFGATIVLAYMWDSFSQYRRAVRDARPEADDAGDADSDGSGDGDVDDGDPGGVVDADEDVDAGDADGGDGNGGSTTEQLAHDG